MKDQQPCLQTARLLVREAEESDWRLIAGLASCPSVTDQHDWLLPFAGDTAARAWVRKAEQQRQMRPRLAYNWIIDRMDQSEAVGWIGFGGCRGSEGSIGYALLPQYWGAGYMTEAVTAVVRHMLDVIGVDSVRAGCDFDNGRSLAVLAKCGFEQSGEVLAEVHGQPRRLLALRTPTRHNNG